MIRKFEEQEVGLSPYVFNFSPYGAPMGPIAENLNN
jgi:hypothetical protein